MFREQLELGRHQHQPSWGGGLGVSFVPSGRLLAVWQPGNLARERREGLCWESSLARFMGLQYLLITWESSKGAGDVLCSAVNCSISIVHSHHHDVKKEREKISIPAKTKFKIQKTKTRKGDYWKRGEGVWT